MSETTATKITIKEATPKTNANGAYAIIVAQDDVKYYAFPPKTASPQEKQQFLSHLAIGKTVIAHWKQNGNFKNITAIEPVHTPVQEPPPVAPEAKISPVIQKPVQSITPDNKNVTMAVSYGKDLMVAGIVKPDSRLGMKILAWISNTVADGLDEATNDYIDQVANG